MLISRSGLYESLGRVKPRSAASCNAVFLCVLWISGTDKKSTDCKFKVVEFTEMSLNRIYWDVSEQNLLRCLWAERNNIICEKLVWLEKEDQVDNVAKISQFMELDSEQLPLAPSC